MAKRILLLGDTGKMGCALNGVFRDDYLVMGMNTGDFDALDFSSVREIIKKVSPDIVMNTVAFLGIDPCESEPEKAFRLNVLFPGLLARLSYEAGFLLVHFSTDAVFDGDKGGFYREDDIPSPLNVYGITKYGGDCIVKAGTSKYYIFRLSVLFGETAKESQFVEKMLKRIKDGHRVLKISDDIISSPTYSRDVANEVKRIIEGGYPSGIYHIANAGKGTLYELMVEVVDRLNLAVEIKKASYKEFPYVGRKNLNTPLQSLKVSSLRHWREAVKDYCSGGGVKSYD